MLEYKVIGTEKIIQKMMTIMNRINSDAFDGLKDASNIFRDSAIYHLQPKLSKSFDAIRDKRRWGVSKISQTQVRLTSHSSHSQAVEFGTTTSSKLRGGKFHATDLTKTGRAFPVGASQGGAVTFSATIRPIQGKHFLLKAIYDGEARKRAVNEVAKMVKKSIGGI